MNQRLNHRWNSIVHKEKWKCKHNIPQLMEHSESSVKGGGGLITTNTCIKKWERSQINNLALHLYCCSVAKSCLSLCDPMDHSKKALHLKELKKEEQTKPSIITLMPKYFFSTSHHPCHST